MKSVLVIATALVFCVSVKAYQPVPQTVDFSAPIVADADNLVDVQFGQIVYDNDAGTFRGLSNTGVWRNLSSSSGFEVTSSGSGYRIERVTLAAPSGGNCAVSLESGDWVNGTPTSSGTGYCSITFVTGTFSAPPTCMCTSHTGGRYCSVGTINSSAVEVSNWLNGSAENSALGVICMGPK